MTDPLPPREQAARKERKIYEAAWSATPLDAKPDTDSQPPAKAVPEGDRRRGGGKTGDTVPPGTLDPEAGGTARATLRRLWEERRPELLLGAGALVLVAGLLLAFLGYRADQASNQVSAEELARAQAALDEERGIVGRGRETVEAYLAAVEEYVVSVAEVDALSAQELAKSEEIAAAFGTNVETFNRLVGERAAILAEMNLKIEELQDAGANVDEAFTDLAALGEIAGRARGGGGN